jgi:hypothetical protein
LDSFDVNPDIAPKIAAKEAELATLRENLPTLWKVADAARIETDTAWVHYLDDVNLRSDYNNVINGTYATHGYSLYWSTYVPTMTIVGVEFRHRGPKNQNDDTYYWSGYLEYYNENIYSRYESSTGQYYWYWEYSYISGTEYASKEDFLTKVSLDALKNDTATYAAEIKVYYTQLNAIGAQVLAAGQDEAAKKVTFDATQKTYQDTLFAFANTKPVPQSHQDTLNLNLAKAAYDGTKYILPFYGSVYSATFEVSDTTGGASGKYKLAQDAYNKLLATERTITISELPAKKSQLNTAIAAIEDYNNKLEILSNGPLVKLNDKVDSSYSVYNDKNIIYYDANTEYWDAVNETQSITTFINGLLSLELEGLVTDGSGRSTYVQRAKDWVKTQIEIYTKNINDATVSLENYKRELANITLYAKDGSKAVDLVIAEKKENIAKLKSEIAELEIKIKVKEAELKLVADAIDSLLLAAE